MMSMQWRPHQPHQGIAVQHGHSRCYECLLAGAHWQGSLHDPTTAGLDINVWWKLKVEWYGVHHCSVVLQASIRSSRGSLHGRHLPMWAGREGQGAAGKLRKEVVMKSEIHDPGQDFTDLKKVRKCEDRNSARHSTSNWRSTSWGWQDASQRLRQEWLEDHKVRMAEPWMKLKPGAADQWRAYSIIYITHKDMTPSSAFEKQRTSQHWLTCSRTSGTKNYGIEFQASKETTDTEWTHCMKSRHRGWNLHRRRILHQGILAMICLSSAEAEFDGGVAACSEAICSSSRSWSSTTCQWNRASGWIPVWCQEYSNGKELGGFDAWKTWKPRVYGFKKDSKGSSSNLELWRPMGTVQTVRTSGWKPYQCRSSISIEMNCEWLAWRSSIRRRWLYAQSIRWEDVLRCGISADGLKMIMLLVGRIQHGWQWYRWLQA